MTRACLIVMLLALALPATGTSAQTVDFQRDVRPILSDVCFKCHGPDPQTREADLRLDIREGATGDLGGHAAVVPGNTAASEVVRRVRATDPDERMPPPDSGRQLTPAQIRILERWIEQGAPWDEHWSFVPPDRPVLPRAGDLSWSRNAIDRFVLSRLQAAGVRPSPPADKATLLRRVTLDLTGLPPSTQEVEQFVQDPSADAYERLVDRLLDSPRYGERMTTPWLDAARYADTNGYSIDNGRDMWRWRDWVIHAINANMPFDQFTIQQLAGDLLPEADLQQQIATGFHREQLVNTEAGSIPEEFRVQYVVDRVHTTSTVWLGLTLQCAQCHDHKYDPITREDFYRLFAYFNTIDEAGLDGYFGNPRPRVSVADEAWSSRKRELESRIESLQSQIEGQSRRIETMELSWLEALTEKGFVEPPATEGLWRFDGGIDESRRRSFASDSWRGEPKFQEGVLGQSLAIDSDRAVRVQEAGNIRLNRPSGLSVWVWPQGSGRFVLLSRMDDSDFSRGWDLYCVNDRIYFRLIEQWPHRAIRVGTPPVLAAQAWSHLVLSWDGSGRAAGVRIWINGIEQPLEASHDSVLGPVHTPEPLVVGSRDSFFNFTGRFDQLRTFDRALTGDEVLSLTAEPVFAWLNDGDGVINDARAAHVRQIFLAVAAPPEVRQLQLELDDLKRQQSRHLAAEPTVMVMREQDRPRATHMLERGQYDQPGKLVTPATPAALPPLADDAPANRLGLARWLVDGQNPLTARVTVNREWQQFFGYGIVRTPEDFGAQGEPPTHPELLDWLATEFVRNGWNRKALHRLIVTSATYRQSSTVDEAALAADPDNRLLARGPRLRLDAEVIRDQALAAAGLLVERFGGRPAYPYQPPGLWRELSIDPLGERWTAQVYRQDSDESLYRRGLYMFRKRTAPAPLLDLFDAPNREVCAVRRGRTNTPLQSLLVMNDPAFVEAARMLAQRMIAASAHPDERLRAGWRGLLTRPPRAAELAILRQGLRRQIEHYQEHPSDAAALIEVGESRPDPSLDPVELAAWTMVAGAIMNLDEALTRP